MKLEHEQKYEEMQEHFGIESTPPDDDFATWTKEKRWEYFMRQLKERQCSICSGDCC
jgi:hypothetical protein